MSTIIRTPEYRAWVQAKMRCVNPNDKRYARYGGRGIKMCPEWSGSFKAFLSDIGLRPTSVKGKRTWTLERIDCDGDYCKENCRRETYSKQNRNYSRNVYVERGGKRYCISDLADSCGIKRPTLSRRKNHLAWLEKDWFKPYSVEEAIEKFLLESKAGVAP